VSPGGFTEGRATRQSRHHLGALVLNPLLSKGVMEGGHRAGWDVAV